MVRVVLVFPYYDAMVSCGEFGCGDVEYDKRLEYKCEKDMSRNETRCVHFSLSDIIYACPRVLSIKQ